MSRATCAVGHLSPKTIVAEKKALHIAAQMVDQTVVAVHVEKHKLPGNQEKTVRKSKNKEKIENIDKDDKNQGKIHSNLNVPIVIPPTHLKNNGYKIQNSSVKDRNTSGVDIDKRNRPVSRCLCMGEFPGPQGPHLVFSGRLHGVSEVHTSL